MLISAQIIWQSPLFSIASACAESQQNATMGESEAFLLTTQPHATQNVKTTIVIWLGMDWAGGNVAWDPSLPPHPETTANDNHWDVTVPPSTLRSQQAPFRRKLCRSGCKYEWTHQTLTLQGLAIISGSVTTDVKNQISDWDKTYECQIGLMFVCSSDSLFSASCYTLAVIRMVAVRADHYYCIFKL